MRTTLFVVALAAFDAMLFRLTGVDDLVVGTPTSGRGDDRVLARRRRLRQPRPAQNARTRRA